MVDLDREREDLAAEIHRVFMGVTREGGMSWRDAEIADHYGDEDFATHVDADTCWQDLVEDEKWTPDPGIGGFAFMDPIGFRYYLPPAMLRSLPVGADVDLRHTLTVSAVGEPHSLHEYNLQQLSLLTSDQRRCVRRFVEYNIALAFSLDDDLGFDWWHETLNSYWIEVE